MRRYGLTWDGNPTVKPPFGAAAIDWGHPLTRSLSGCWLLNGLGNDVASPARTTGSLSGGAKWSPFGLDLDGTDDFLDMGDVTQEDGATGLSVLVRARARTLGTGRRLVSKWNETSTNRSHLMGLDDTNQDELIAAVSAGGSPTEGIDVWKTTAADLAAATWYDIGYTWTDTARAIYVNGLSQAITTTLDRTTPSVLNSSAPLNFGAADNGASGNEWDGFIDRVYIWRRALSSAEMLWLHAEPYAFLRPTVYRRWFVPAAAAVYSGRGVGRGIARGVYR